MDHGTEHEWELIDGAPNLTRILGGEEPKSDVWQCSKCGQVCLAEIGGPPDEGAMGDLLEECGKAVMESVMES